MSFNNQLQPVTDDIKTVFCASAKARVCFLFKGNCFPNLFIEAY